MQNLQHELRVDNLVTPQDVATAATVNTNAGMYRSMAKYRKGLVVVIAHLTNLKTCSAQLTCDVGATATAGKANVTGKTVLLTGTTAAPEQVGVIEFDVNDLTAIAATKFFVGVDLTTNQDGDDVAAVLVRGAARYYMGTAMPV
ncbi:hypothetical protein ES703_116512 [subsurface metagenome]